MLETRRTFSMAALLALVLALSPASAEPVRPAGRQFVALSVPDAAASADWYRRAFGLTVSNEVKTPDGRVRVLLVGSEALQIELLEHRDAKPSSVPADSRHLVHGTFKFGFYVDDLDRAVAHLRGMEAELLTDVIDDEAQRVRFVLLRDISGNVLQLFDTPPAAGRAAPPER